MLRSLTALLLLCTPPIATPLPTPPARVLDRATAPYREDAPGARPVAAIDAELHRQDGGVRLRVRLRARGDEVVPMPGFEGVHGANLRTAEELDRLLREQQLRLIARVDGASRPGTLLEVVRAPLPERRLDAAGRLVAGATTRGEWPIAATFESSPLPEGSTWCHLLADGLPRLAVHVVDVCGAARIAAIESLAETGGAPGGSRR